MTSLRTTFTHNLASEYSLRARVEAEMEGARIQAKKLSVMLARSESRNEEIDRERAMSAEEEVLWQEEMKDHASAYAQQQAARARAAQMAQVQSHYQKLSNNEVVKGEFHNEDAETRQAEPHHDLGSGPLPLLPNHLSNGLDEPFEERKGDDGAVTGLGISAGPVEVSSLNSSPLSTIVKERNKLLSDKRYLKSRVRDTEAQRDRLEAELKSLRPLLVRGATSKSASTPHVSATTPVIGGNATSTPGRSQKRDRSRHRRQATMGDAEAEHLLLAARRLREINRQKYVDEDGRPRTPPPHSGATPVSTQPRTPKTPKTATSRDMMESVFQSGASSRLVTNGSPLALKNGNPASTLGRWGTLERVDSSGIEDLLQAAQTVLTPEKKSAHRQSHSRSKSGPELPESEEEEKDFTSSQHRTLLSGVTFSSKDLGPLNESPKRRRVSSAALEGSRNGLIMSPDARTSAFQGGRRTRISTEGAKPFMSQSSAGLSALDLLADQAAASQHPSQSSDPSGGSGEGEANMDPDEVFGSDDEEGMAIDDEDEPIRPTGEGGIGSHYYPRGAYGQTYAQQPASMGQDGYRRSSQAGYTYGPVGTSSPSTSLSLASQGWNPQSSINGIYAPRGVSPPLVNSRFAAIYQNGPRITTGSISQHTSKGSSLPDEYSNQHNSNRTTQKGGNTSPDKRLPYVRWSDEEDQKLRKAINEYGQRWESVARVVGTRSYHQCRQRYLLMRRKEAAARDGNSNEESRSANHVTAGVH